MNKTTKNGSVTKRSDPIEEDIFLYSFSPPLFRRNTSMTDVTLPLDRYKAIAAVHPDGQKPKKRLVSARIYEFFCTNFAQHNICRHRGIDIGKDYLARSQGFSFYRRNKEIIYNIKPLNGAGDHLAVTNEQLAFFEWVVDYDIFSYIVARLQVINAAREGMKQLASSRILLAPDETATMEELAHAFDTMGIANEDEVKVGLPRNRRFLARTTQAEKKVLEQQQRREEQFKKQQQQQQQPTLKVSPRQVHHKRRSVDEDEDDERTRAMREAYEQRQTELAERKHAIEKMQRLAERERRERQVQQAKEKQQKIEQKRLEKDLLRAEKRRLQDEKKQQKVPSNRTVRSSASRRSDEQQQHIAEWLYPSENMTFARDLGL